jgi:hypothetical protein
VKFSIKVSFGDDKMLCEKMKFVLDAALQQQISRPMRRLIENTANGQHVTVADLTDMHTALSNLPEMMQNKRERQNVFEVIEALISASNTISRIEQNTLQPSGG